MNVESLRHDTAGCEKVIHFNNAGAALISNETYQVQKQYFEEELLIGGYEVAARYESTVNDFYRNAAKLINCDPEEMAYTESATVAWQRPFWSIPFNVGDEILCDHSTYASNYIAFINAKEKYGIKIITASSKENGTLDTADLENKISDRTKLISITHMPTNSGLVNPAEEVGEIAHKNEIMYQLDACQSAGQYPIDVKKIKCDFLSATGRKYLRGPRGTGFLFVKKERIKALQPQSLDLHSAEWISNEQFSTRDDAKKFETWECNVGAKLGLSAAIDQANTLGIKDIWSRIQKLAAYFRSELSEIKHIEVTDIGDTQSGIVTFRSNTIRAEELKDALSAKNVNTVVAIKSGTLLDMSDRGLDSVVRASIHYYNTEAEVDRFISLLSDIVSER